VTVVPEYFSSSGRDSVVGVATGYGVDGPGIASRWVATFFARVQTGCGVYQAPCTVGIGSLSRA
jgi:hypothetical protein